MLQRAHAGNRGEGVTLACRHGASCHNGDGLYRHQLKQLCAPCSPRLRRMLAISDHEIAAVQRNIGDRVAPQPGRRWSRSGASAPLLAKFDAFVVPDEFGHAHVCTLVVIFFSNVVNAEKCICFAKHVRSASSMKSTQLGYGGDHQGVHPSGGECPDAREHRIDEPRPCQRRPRAPQNEGGGRGYLRTDHGEIRESGKAGNTGE